MSLPALNANLLTDATLTTDHGTVTGGAAASSSGDVAAHASAATEHVSAAADAAGHAGVEPSNLAAEISSGFHVALAHVGSFMGEIKATLAATLPALPF